MSDVINFTPVIGSNATLVLSIGASAKTAVQLAALDGYAGGELLLSNQGTTVWLFVGFGTTATLAQTGAAIPSDGSTSGALPVPPGWQIGVTMPPNMWVSAIGSAAGPTNLWITQGRGAG